MEYEPGNKIDEMYNGMSTPMTVSIMGGGIPISDQLIRLMAVLLNQL